MKDSFGNPLKLGDRVIYGVPGCGGTEYVIGTISQLYPHNNAGKPYPPDRVSIEPIKTARNIKFTKHPIIYASSVVLISGIA